MNVNFPSPYDEKTRAMHKRINCFSLSDFLFALFLSQKFSSLITDYNDDGYCENLFSTMKIVVVCRWYPSEIKNRNNSIKLKFTFMYPRWHWACVGGKLWESESENFKVYIVVVVCRHERWCEMQEKERGILKEETLLLLQIPLNSV